MATVSDLEIKNDDVVYMVFPKENGSGWEDVNIETFSAEQTVHMVTEGN